MDIIAALVDHHHELRRLYQASENDPQGFGDFVRHLIVHHTMEEKYFYDLLQQIQSAEHDALEAVNEHHIIELIIKDAEGFPSSHEHFPIKIEGLGEYTVHHLDEEEAEIFPLAETLIGLDDRQALGALFLEAKEKLLSIDVPEVTDALLKSATGGNQTSSSARGLGIGSLK